jgi:hypothetical protein
MDFALGLFVQEPQGDGVQVNIRPDAERSFVHQNLLGMEWHFEAGGVSQGTVQSNNLGMRTEG